MSTKNNKEITQAKIMIKMSRLNRKKINRSKIDNSKRKAMIRLKGSSRSNKEHKIKAI